MSEDWQNPKLNELNSPGDVVQGDYLGVESQTKTNSGGDYVANFYKFIDEEGDEFTIKGTTSIDKQMQKVPVGSIVRIEYKEDKPTDKGNPFKVFKVQFKTAPSGELSKTKAQERREAQAAKPQAGTIDEIGQYVAPEYRDPSHSYDANGIRMPF